MADEGIDMPAEEDSIDDICRKHAILTQAEHVEEEDSPALQDVAISASARNRGSGGVADP